MPKNKPKDALHRRNLEALVSQIFELRHECAAFVKFHDLIATADADAIYQDIGNGPTPSLVLQRILQLGSDFVLV